MRTVRRLLYRQIIASVAFVTVAFLALFFFIDLVDELQRVGRNGFGLEDAVWAAVMALPGHIYDVFPITLMIGTILALSRLAQSSEFTILRTAGLGPGRALTLLGLLGLGGVVFMLMVGEWLVPWSEQAGSLHAAQFRQGQMLKLGRGGAWLREQTDGRADAARQVTVNVGGALGERRFQQVRLFEFDGDGRLVRRITAEQAEVRPGNQRGQASVWQLQNVVDTRWLTPPPNGEDQVGQALVLEQRLPTMAWTSDLSPEVVAASVLPIDTMSTASLWRYTQHLSRNAQAAQKYELQFWKKAFSPLVCLVMVALALPFAYMQSRSGGMSFKVFGGIMLGISFVLVNHITGHLGLLNQWRPWLAASLPSLTYLALSLAAFVWLVRNR